LSLRNASSHELSEENTERKFNSIHVQSFTSLEIK
jgi:hypothetical protein